MKTLGMNSEKALLQHAVAKMRDQSRGPSLV